MCSIFNWSAAVSAACVTLMFATGCPRPVTSTEESLPPEKSSKTTAASTSKEDSAELSAVLKAISAARERLQAVIAQVPANKDLALDLERRLGVLKNRLGDEAVKAEMTRAAQELEAAQATPKSPTLDDGQRRAVALMETAAEVDRALQVALAPLPPAAQNASANARDLRRSAVEQQRALQSMATATRLAFRSLTVVEQLRRAIPRLEGRQSP